MARVLSRRLDRLERGSGTDNGIVQAMFLNALRRANGIQGLEAEAAELDRAYRSRFRDGGPLYGLAELCLSRRKG